MTDVKIKLMDASGKGTDSKALRLMHPQYVLRVAGESPSKLSAIWTGHADQAWKSLVEIRERSASSSQELCDQLARVVSLILDVIDRRRVLDVRRALHNGRPAKAPGLDAVRRHADAALYERIVALDELNVAYMRALQDFTGVVDREIAQSAESMRDLLASRNLQLALSYNNYTLLVRLKNHYRERSHASDHKTVRNLEDSLLQFYCRASTKTSPLSSLTLIRVGKWQTEGGATVNRLSNCVERRIEAKAALMRHIFKSWMRNYQIASKAFPLALNPTMVESDGKWHLQLVAAGKDFIGRIWGTGVDLFSCDASPMLACVRRAFDNAPDAALWAPALIDQICAVAPKLPRQAVGAYVQKLYEIGYLIAQTGFVEQVDMLAWVEQIVDRLDGDTAADFRAAIARLQANLEVMRSDDVEQRIAASLDVDPSVFDLATAAGAFIGGYLYRTPYYENCYYVGQDQDLSSDVLVGHQKEFDLIQQINRVIDTNQLIHTSLCDYFVSRFGKDGVCTDVHGFIEAFDATYAPLVSEGKVDAEGVAEASPRTLALLRAKRAFDDYLKQKLGQGRDIQLNPDALRGIVAMLPQGMRKRSVSYSYLVQPFKKQGVDCLVLNQVYGGRAGILSRFCEVLDDDDLAQLRSYLKQGSEVGRNAELGGVFGFNANRHPAMSDTELVIPPFGPSYPHTDKISLSELKLVYLENEHRLEFRGCDDQPIDIWYHGLLTPVMLPAVHRTIALAFSEGPCFLTAGAMASAIETSGSDVHYSPRLSLGNIVVARRSWTLAYEKCPDASLPLAQFYLAVRNWQRLHGLPERFFVRAILGSAAGGGSIVKYGAMKEIYYKDLKPFYVDLRNPRFVRLLQNMMKRHKLSLMISELLPDFDEHTSTVDGEQHVSELHFELTSTAAQSQVQDMHWYALRIAYFGDRGPLLLGPVAEALQTAKRDPGVERAFFLPHWKFGPHVDLVMRCDAEAYALRVLPAMQAILEPWVAAHPSSIVIDPVEYEKTSRWIGTFEIDSGPYLPLLKDNSIVPVPYVRPQTLLIPEVAESKELMLSDCSSMILALYRLKDQERDAFFMTLHAMLVITANTIGQGVKDGYMSMRSHADYFFAAYDSDSKLRNRFDGVDTKNRAQLDQITSAAAAGDYASTGLPPPFVAIVAEWGKVMADIDARSKHIVELRYKELVSQTDHFMDMATQMRQDVPDAYFEQFANRQISEIGDAFINTKTGKEALQRPEFLAYRINVNFFYALLPLLEVPPIQKFLLCHLLANSAERVYNQDWRVKVAQVYAEEELEQ